MYLVVYLIRGQICTTNIWKAVEANHWPRQSGGLNSTPCWACSPPQLQLGWSLEPDCTRSFGVLPTSSLPPRRCRLPRASFVGVVPGSPAALLRSAAALVWYARTPRIPLDVLKPLVRLFCFRVPVIAVWCHDTALSPYICRGWRGCRCRPTCHTVICSPGSGVWIAGAM